MRLAELHHAVEVGVGLVRLEHRELRVVPRRHALVAEAPVDLVHPLEPADDQSLEVELRRDAQIELHVERVVVRDERARRRTARDGVQHRRLDFEELTLLHESPHGRDDLEARLEDLPDLWVGDEVDIALTIAGLGVGQTVVLLRQRPQGLGEQPHVGGRYRELTAARSAGPRPWLRPSRPGRARRSRQKASSPRTLRPTEELQIAGRVADDEEGDLALVPHRRQGGQQR